MKQGSVIHNRWLRSGLSLLVAGLMVGSISYIGVHTYKSSHAATVPTIYASPDSGAVASGSTLSVTLRADSGGEGVNSVQASLNYDASKLTYSSITEAGTFPLVAATSTSSPGIIRVARGNNDSSVTGDNAIVTINFKVTGTSGTGAINIDKANSALVRSSDNSNILANVGTGTYTIAVAPGTQPSGSSTSTSTEKPRLTLSPASGNLPTGSPVSVAVRLHSYNFPISTVEAIVSYPAGQLQYTGLTEGGIYTTKQRTKTDPGSIDIIRAIPGGSSGITGENTVVTLNFKVIGASGPAGLTIAAGSAVFDTSGTGQNILDTAGSKGASYTLGATSSNPVTVVPLSNAAEKAPSASVLPDTVTTPAQALLITAGSGSVALTNDKNGSSLTELTGEVKLTPILDADAQQPGGVQKVEYYLNGKLINTAKVAPYSYSFDTEAMRNGIYTMGIKTYLAGGTVSTKTDKLLVSNPVNMAYVGRHYLLNILGVLALFGVLGALIVKLVLPRRRSHNDTPGDADHDALYGFSDHQSAGGSLVATDPLVIAPVGAGASGVAQPMQPQFSSAAMTTNALPLTPSVSSAGVPTASLPVVAPQNVTSLIAPITTPIDSNQVRGIVQPVSVPRPIAVTDGQDVPKQPTPDQSPPQY